MRHHVSTVMVIRTAIRAFTRVMRSATLTVVTTSIQTVSLQGAAAAGSSIAPATTDKAKMNNIAAAILFLRVMIILVL